MIMPTPTAVLESDVTASAVVAYTEMQSHLRLDGSTDQVLVESIVSAVTQKIENVISRKLITQVWSIYYDFFPSKYKNENDDWWEGTKDGAVSNLYSPVRFLELPFGPCQSAYFIKTFDESDTGSIFDASLYQLDIYSARPKIGIKSGATWPATVLRPSNGVQIKATFGYGTASTAVPAPIKEAVKIMAAKLYENRGDLMIENPTPQTAQMLLEPFKIWRIR